MRAAKDFAADEVLDVLRDDYEDAFNWSMMSEVFFQDHDILALFDASTDGVEDPDEDVNQRLGMGDYRPSAWFRPFANTDGRDGRRPSRR